MPRKGLRRLDLWLPENHWLFSLPAGRRAGKVRELIELAAALERGFDALRRDVAAEIAALREEIRGLRAEAEALRRGSGGASAAPSPPQGQGVSPDAAKRFLAAFG